MNGRTEHIFVERHPREEICQWVEHLRTRSGRQIVRHRKPQHTDSPTTQGIWTPFTNRETSWNVTTFPEQDDSFMFIDHKITATEELLKLSPEYQIIDKNLVAKK